MVSTKNIITKCMMASKIIVTGGNGQLGNCLRDIAGFYPAFEFVFTDVTELDITDSAAVGAFFAQHQPVWVINAAAYTAVDKAEEDRDTVRLINATAVGVLAAQCTAVGAAFVHISTDYVFDGGGDSILSESAVPGPKSVYGLTKLEGERLAAQCERHLIFRTSWLYSAYGKNFVKTMRALGAMREEVSVVADQWGSPTLADDLATGIMTAVSLISSAALPVSTTTGSSSVNDVWGVYHFSNEGATCWADFAQLIMDYSGLKCTVRGITTAEYPTAAARPAFSVMSKQKFCKTFGVTIPEWEDSLFKLIGRLDAESATVAI